MSKEKPTNQQERSFWERSEVIKFKGVAKVAVGALVVLQPHYALLIGGTICAGGIGASIYNKVRHRSWSRMAEDFRDGTFWTELKDTLGMGAGSSIGLLSPATGLAVAAAGAISYFVGSGQGVEGLFKGGFMASTVAMTLPVIGAAFIAEGLANVVMGKDYNLIRKSLEYSKSVFKSVAKFVGIAEVSKEQPKAVESIVKQGETPPTQPLAKKTWAERVPPQQDTSRAAQVEASKNSPADVGRGNL